jgi:intein/homing endonuclease
MEDGSVKPMKDVKVGDRVKTYNPDTDEVSANEVTHLLKRHVASELIHIKLSGGIEFRATPEHECWIRRGDEGMWVMAELIEPGDSMMTEGIEYKVVESTERVEYPEGIEVGNFSVADAHVYFANKVLLHNFTGL